MQHLGGMRRERAHKGERPCQLGVKAGGREGGLAGRSSPNNNYHWILMILILNEHPLCVMGTICSTFHVNFFNPHNDPMK